MDRYFKDLIQSSINPARAPEERDPWNEFLLNLDAGQIDVPLIQPEIDVPQPEIDEPQPEIDEPQPEIDEPQPEINEPQPEIDEPQPEIDEPQPEIDAPQPGVHEPEPEINEPEPREPVAQPAIPYPEVPLRFELPFPSYDGQFTSIPSEFDNIEQPIRTFNKPFERQDRAYMFVPEHRLDHYYTAEDRSGENVPYPLQKHSGPHQSFMPRYRVPTNQFPCNDSSTTDRIQTGFKPGIGEGFQTDASNWNRSFEQTRPVGMAIPLNILDDIESLRMVDAELLCPELIMEMEDTICRFRTWVRSQQIVQHPTGLSHMGPYNSIYDTASASMFGGPFFGHALRCIALYTAIQCPNIVNESCHLYGLSINDANQSLWSVSDPTPTDLHILSSILETGICMLNYDEGITEGFRFNATTQATRDIYIAQLPNGTFKSCFPKQSSSLSTTLHDHHESSENRNTRAEGSIHVNFDNSRADQEPHELPEADAEPISRWDYIKTQTATRTSPETTLSQNPHTERREFSGNENENNSAFMHTSERYYGKVEPSPLHQVNRLLQPCNECEPVSTSCIRVNFDNSRADKEPHELPEADAEPISRWDYIKTQTATRTSPETTLSQNPHTERREFSGNENENNSAFMYASERYYGKVEPFPLHQEVNQLLQPCNECESVSTSCMHFTANGRIVFQQFKQELSSSFYGHNTISEYLTVQQDKRLTRQLPDELKNWTAIKNAMDGNCFYSAISNALVADQYLGKTLRKCCILEMLTSNTLQGNFKEVFEHQTSINESMRDGVWAVPANIQLMSSLIGRRIIVFSPGRSNQLSAAYYDATNGSWIKGGKWPIFLYLEGDHFTTLVKNSNDVKEPAVNYEIQDFRENNMAKEDLRQYIYNATGRSAPTDGIEVISLSDDSDDGVQNNSPHQQKRENANNERRDSLTCPTRTCLNLKTSGRLQEGDHINPNRDFSSASKCSPSNNDSKTIVTDFISGSPSSVEAVLPTPNKPETQYNPHNVDQLAKEPKRYPNRYVNANETLFNAALQSMQEELYRLKTENKNQDCINYIKKIAEGTSVWYRHVKEICGNKESPKVINNKSRTLHTLQKQEKFRSKVKQMLNNINANDLLVPYLNEIKKKGPESNKWITQKQMQNELTTREVIRETGPNLIKTQTIPACDTSNETAPTESSSCDYDSGLEEQKPEMEDPIKNLKSDAETLKDATEGSDYVNKNKNNHRKDQERINGNFNDQIGLAALCAALNLTPTDIEYQPPMQFEINLPANIMEASFDFNTNKFVKYKWAKEMSKALTTEQKVCSFIARSVPQYNEKKGLPFCRMVGHCACGMKFAITVNEKPVKGIPMKCNVKSTGLFHLRQDKPTSRPVMGDDRNKIAEELEKMNPKKLFLKDLEHLSGIRILHQNFAYKSSSVLKKIVTEKKTHNRTHADKHAELQHLQQTFKDPGIPDGQLNGYIQKKNDSNGELFISMFSRNSILLHLDQLSRPNVTIHVDATGGICKKSSEKQTLLYVVHGVTNDGSRNISYPIAECLMESGTNSNIAHFFDNIKEEIIKLRPDYRYKSIAGMIVSDWSYATIHAIFKGFNNETLKDYLDRSWNFLNDDQPWDKCKSSVFICSAHLIKAVQRNLYQKLTKTKENKRIVNLALKGVARFQECFSLKEFREVTRVFVQTFGTQHIDEDELNNNTAYFNLTKQFQHELVPENADEEGVENEQSFGNSTKKLLRHHSKFYGLFREIRDSVISSGVDTELPRNPYYCKAVVDVIMNDKIMLWPLWSSAIQQKLGNKTFLRSTNAAIESEFNLRKNVYHQLKNTTYLEYLPKSKEYHLQRVKEAVVNLGIRSSKVYGFKKAKPAKESATEKWSKKPKKRRTKHFSAPFETKLKSDNLRPSESATFEPNDNSEPDNNDGRSTDKFQKNPESTDRKSSDEAGRSTDKFQKNPESTDRKSSDEAGRSTDKLQQNPESTDRKSSDEAGNLKPPRKPDLNKEYRTVVCSVEGSNSLTRVDLAHTLRGDNWIHSDVIDTYTSLCRNTFNPHNIHVSTSPYIFRDNEMIWRGLGQTSPSPEELPEKPEFILHPLSLGNHWVLLLFDKSSGVCTIYDSLRGPPSSSSRSDLIQDIYTHVLPVFSENSRSFASKQWKVFFNDSISRQRDSQSCGVNLLVYAKCLFYDPTGSAIPKTIDPMCARHQILKELLNTTDDGRKLLSESNGNYALLKNVITKDIKPEERFSHQDFKR